MNATPPEAKSEYSRGRRRSGRLSAGHAPGDPGASEADLGPDSEGTAKGATPPPRSARAAILGSGLLGALLLLVAEFTTLFEIRAGAGGTAIKTVGTGSHHTFALVPIALLVAVLSYAVFSATSRPALLSIGVLGVIGLLIGLLGDLPDAHASGLIGGGATHFTTASATPSAGLYMETLGSVVLLITCACGFLLLGPPPRARPAGSSAGRPGRPDSHAAD